MDLAAEFPGLAKSTYLNSCAHGLLPRRTRRVMEEHLQRWEDAPDWSIWSKHVDEARATFARLIHARPEDVAVQANASSGISAVMSAFREPGRIVTLDADFPSAPFVAQRQTARGFAHEHLRTGGHVRAREWGPRVEGARLACIPAVASFNGYRLDVPTFVAEAHARGTPVLVDAFQATGTYPIDVKAWDVDFLVTGVYKWLLAPAGLAFLYVKPELQERLSPTTGGWYAAAEPYAFDPLGPVAPDARRFEYGGPSIVGCAAFVESAKLLLELGIANVEARDRRLIDRVLEHAAARKYEVLTPEDPAERASIVTFRVPDLQRALDACARENVIVNPRLGGIRVSPHFYNRESDVDRLFEVLDRASAS